VLARGTPGHCKWHPGWEPLVYSFLLFSFKCPLRRVLLWLPNIYYET